MITEYISTTGFAYFGFGTNDPATGANDDADSTPSAFLREVGAAASGAPITTGLTVSLLSHATYPAGLYEVEVDAATASLTANTRYDVFISATVNSTTSVACVGRVVTTELLNGASVQQECEDALAAYDPPTKAELDSGLAGLNDLSSSDISDAVLPYFQVTLRSDAAIATDRSATLTAINTNEGSGAGDYDNTTDAVEATQDDLTTVDTVVDSVKTKTDQLTFSAAGFVDANIMEVNDNGGLTGDGDATPISKA